MKEGLNWFKTLIFISSKQDAYINFESARIQVTEFMQKEGKEGQICKKMA